VQAQPASTPPVAAPAPALDREALFWQSIQASTNAADFEEYVRQFPSGVFAGIARNRIASLRPAPAPTIPAPQVAPAPAVGVYDASGINARTAPGTRFRDCADCPEMIVVPPGSFLMGAPASEQERFNEDEPPQSVSVRAFALGVTPVTFAEWDACVAARRCSHRPSDQGWGRGTRPVINVSWNDARGYAAWLSSRRPGVMYRLPTDAEWEYAARAGTTTARWWGEEISVENTNCESCGSQWDNRMTAPVGSFRANGFGLHDMLGNVWQWVDDCRGGTPTRPPSGDVTGLCGMRGGAYGYPPRFVRAGHRALQFATFRLRDLSFRVARTLTQ
jgi:formylglycine-generating enzyme required for sulfatase activity